MDARERHAAAAPAGLAEGERRRFPRDPYGDFKKKRKPAHVVSAAPEQDAQRLLSGFLRRAFRRAVTGEEVAHYLGSFSAELKKGAHFQDALKTACRAALTSPDFLMLGTRRDAFALAGRLSAFLWSSVPDDALLAAAEKGELSKPRGCGRRRSACWPIPRVRGSSRISPGNGCICARLRRTRPIAISTRNSCRFCRIPCCASRARILPSC